MGFENIKNFPDWFKNKLEKQELEKPSQININPIITSGVKSEALETILNSKTTNIMLIGTVVTHTVTKGGKVTSTIRIEDDDKDGYLVAIRDFFIVSSDKDKPELGSKINITVTF